MDVHLRFAHAWIKRNFKRKPTIKKSDLFVFLKNTEFLVDGLRSAFTPERIALPDEVLLKLLEEVTPRFNRTIKRTAVSVLKINDHTVVANVEKCLAILEAAIETDMRPRPIITDISGNNTLPCVLPWREMDRTIVEACRQILKSLTFQRSPEKIALLTMNMEHGVNLCTIFGIVLGYPVVYYFHECEKVSNCLDMIPLVVTKMCDASSQVEVFSFSYPQCLYSALNDVVEDWSTKWLMQKSVNVKTEVVTLPCVTF